MSPGLGSISPLFPLLAPLVRDIKVSIGGYPFPVGQELAEVLQDLSDGNFDAKEGRRLVVMTVMNASHLIERDVVIGGRSYNFTPFVIRLLKDLVDVDLSREDIQDIVPALLAVVLASKAVPKVPAGVPIVIPVGGVS